MATDTTTGKAPAAARKGRPATGQALSSTQRSRNARARQRQGGGKKITAQLSPEGAAALAQLRRGGGTVGQVVSAALVAALGPPTV
jgi:hypothetical protein